MEEATSSLNSQVASDLLWQVFSWKPHEALNRGDLVGGLPQFLVHYTSTQAASEIITARDDQRCLWMRNATEMNDFKEIAYGHEMVSEVFNDAAFRADFMNVCSVLIPQVSQVTKLIDIDLERRATYLLSLSDHNQDELERGRLSMWRAYGGRSNVALSFNVDHIYTLNYRWPVLIVPVDYRGSRGVRVELTRVMEEMAANLEMLSRIEPVTIEYALKSLIRTIMLTTKHPGFEEEREWRLIHHARQGADDLKEHSIPSKIVNVDGVVQRVHYLPLRKMFSEGMTGQGLTDLLDRLIIGPTTNESIVREAFVQLLHDAGVTDAEKRVFVSGIPLRR